MNAKTVAQRQKEFRAKMRAQGLKEIRSLFAHPGDTGKVRTYVERLNRKRHKMQKRYQQSVNVNGHKIKLVITSRSSVGNFIGWSARVTDNQNRDMKIRMIKVLRPQDALDKAYIKFVNAL